MEKNTSFDLTAAIQRWRETLSHSPNFRAGDIDELESHLRDSVRELEARGLSAEEAFTIAVRRIGPAPALAAEFGIINGSSIWIDRMLWLLIGWASLSTLQESLRLFGVLAVIGRAYLFSSTASALLLALLWVLPFVVVTLVLKSLIRSDGRVPRTRTRLLNGPWRLSFAFLLVLLLPYLFRLVSFTSLVGRVSWNVMLWGNVVVDPRLQIVEETYAGYFGSVLAWIVIPLSILILEKLKHRRSPMSA
jgi:hypothetical protein